MSCECVETINEKLKPYNTRLTQAMMLQECAHPGLMLQTDQIESGRGKKKAVSIFLSYCPFCGNKYAQLSPNKEGE